MSTPESIVAAVREFILQQFPLARKLNLGDDDSLLEQSIVDSLGVLEIVTFVEREFSIAMTDDELTSEHFESINSIARLVEQKLKTDNPAWTS